MDVTELLGVTKYDPPEVQEKGGVHIAGKPKGNFPNSIPKTDEPRVQGIKRILDNNIGTPCYITEKVDGTSATFYFKDGVFGCCSRNIDLKEDDINIYWKMARQYDLKAKMESLSYNVAIQGEVVGAGIQQNKYKFKTETQQLFVFNIFNIDKYEYLSFNEFMSIANDLGLQTVPLLETNYSIVNDIDSIVQKSIRKSTLNKESWAEGIVIRPLVEKNTIDGRLSFKAVNHEFLLKHDDRR
jgi:RNA ligase (TIGR02306 family)